MHQDSFKRASRSLGSKEQLCMDFARAKDSALSILEQFSLV